MSAENLNQPIDITNPVNNAEDELSHLSGALVQSLQRSNKQIKADRALEIAELGEQAFRRKVEDIENSVKTLRRKQNNMLDMSPNNTQSLILAENFDADSFVEKYLSFGVQIRTELIKLEVARQSYNFLFGK